MGGLTMQDQIVTWGGLKSASKLTVILIHCVVFMILLFQLLRILLLQQAVIFLYYCTIAEKYK